VLLFAAGGARRLDDFKRDVAAHFADFNAEPHEIASGFNALEQRVYARHVAPAARVCVIGCGTGRDLIPFVSAGHDTVGIDPSGDAVEILRRELTARGKSAALIHAFAEDIPLPGRFDAIILSPQCYAYIPGTERRIALLKKLAAHLNPGGRIAISYLRRTATWSTAGVRVASAVARLTRSDVPWEPHDIIQLNDMKGRRTLTFEHFFLVPELEQEIARAGMRVIESQVDDFLGPLTVAGL
jgi:SAM-dependent methyltransferase